MAWHGGMHHRDDEAFILPVQASSIAFLKKINKLGMRGCEALCLKEICSNLLELQLSQVTVR
jgi:hypothetical protein